MDVLFLALGTSRLRGVIDEAAEVVAAGGTAVVLTEKAGPWRRSGLDPAVRVVQLPAGEPAHLPGPVEWLLLFRLPRLFGWLVARGPLARFAGRLERAVERRVAARAARQAFLPGARRAGEAPESSRVWRDTRWLLIRHTLLRGRSFDLMVVGDPVSIPLAVALTARCARPLAPVLTYQLDTGRAVVATRV